MTTANSNTRLQQVGRILGPILALGFNFATLNTLPEPARLTACCGVLMVVFWVTEAIPLAATAMLPLLLFPLLGVMDIQQTAAPFAKPVIFLFLGGFMLAAAVERCGLHRRVALAVVRLVGQSPGKLLAGCMIATAFLSMWISNTAATVMMLPIATSLTSLLQHKAPAKVPVDRRRLEICFLLGIAYSANIGGLGTIVGTPPNALLVGFLQEQGITISFFRWMLFAVPLVLLLLSACWLVLYRWALDNESRSLSVCRVALDEQYQKLGPITREQVIVMIVFAFTVALWVLREPLSHWQCFHLITRLDDASIAIAAAVTLFLLPSSRSSGERILDWQTARGVPWGVLLLIGGGMSLGSAMGTSGLTDVIGAKLEVLLWLPTILLLLAVTGLVLFLTEVISNTAITAATLPVLYALGAQATGGSLNLVVAATLAASCAFMLPVGTPPNAVVFATGHVPMHAMMRYGLWLNLLATLLITGTVYLLGAWLFA